MKTLGIITIIVCLVTIVVGIAMFLVSPRDRGVTQTEKTAAYSKLLGRASILTQPLRPTGWKTYNGTYFSLEYPAAANIYTADQPTPNNATILEKLHFQEINSYNCIIEVAHAGSNNTYDDVSGVTFRRLKKDQYQEKDFQLLGTSAVSFTNTIEGYEETVFLLKDGKLFTLSFTSPDESSKGLFNHILSSLHIK